MLITDINQLDVNGTYTYADYLLWRFKEQVELLRGKLFKMSPAPREIHQRVLNEINFELMSFLEIRLVGYIQHLLMCVCLLKEQQITKYIP